MAFLLIASLLFVADAVVSPEGAAQRGDRITVSTGRLLQLAESYRLLTGVSPTTAELQNLVLDFVDEEIAYREAIDLGLDRDDTVIRRRLRQKVEFATLDTASIEAPTDAQLGAWFDAHRPRYRVPERRALRAITFLDEEGSALRRAERALQRLGEGTAATALGDRTLLPETLPLTTREGVARQLGEDAAAAAFAAAPGRWVGPVASVYGAHLLRVQTSEPPRQPRFEDLRQQVLEDWTRDREAQELEAFRQALRARYEVVINWPETGDPRVAATAGGPSR